ncbi:MAG: hypothetical protein Q4F31_09965 [Eubacteriales bacterium]|nr:hypothetical protein [Eubacteriales bacterium]
MSTLESLTYEAGILPILFADKKEVVRRVIGAVEQTALPALEILQRGPLAEEALQAAVQAKKKTLIGAGTVCTLEQCKKVVAMGADFIVTPGCDLSMVDWCLENNVSIVPGATSVSELMALSSRGLKLVKMFPFRELGGVTYLNGYSGPFPELKFVITGSVDDRELPLLCNPKIAAVGGVWVFQSEEDRTVIPDEEIIYRANTSLSLAKHYRQGWQAPEK